MCLIRFLYTFLSEKAIMKKLTEVAMVMSVLCFLCGPTLQMAVADTAVWTGAGENDDVFNPDNWAWLEG